MVDVDGRSREAILGSGELVTACVFVYSPWPLLAVPRCVRSTHLPYPCVACSVFETTESVVLELELMSRNDLFDELSTAGVLKEHKTAAIVYQVHSKEWIVGSWM